MNFLPQPIPGCASFLSSLLHQLRTSKFYPSKQQVIDGPFTKLLLTCHFDQSDPLSVFPAHQRPLTSSSILTGGFINYVVAFFNLSNLVLVLLQQSNILAQITCHMLGTSLAPTMSFWISSALDCSLYRWHLFVYFTFP